MAAASAEPAAARLRIQRRLGTSRYIRKVITLIGSFTNIRGGHVFPEMVRKAEAKPIRVFLQDGSNDNRRPNDLKRDWFLQNQAMVEAFKEKKYDLKFVFTDGTHSDQHGGTMLPEAARMAMAGL